MKTTPDPSERTRRAWTTRRAAAAHSRIRRYDGPGGPRAAILERDRQMLLLQEGGATYRELSERFGISVDGIRAALARERRRRAA